MATATLTETPEEILVWMKKFGFDARSMKQRENDDSKKLSEEIARLLNELQSLPKSVPDLHRGHSGLRPGRRSI